MSTVFIGAVLFSALLHAGWNGLIRRSKAPLWTVGWIGISTFFVCAPFLPFVGFPYKVWPFILTSSTLRVISIGLLAQAYKVGELSFTYPVARGASPVLVTLGGLMLASEKLGVVQGLGIFLTVVGMITIGLEAKHWDRTGMYIALASGVVIATYTVVDGIGARRSGLPTQYNLWCFSLYGLTILILRFAISGKESLKGARKDILLAIGGGVMCVGAYAIVTRAMVHTPMGLVSALRETSTLFAGAIGIIFLKEQMSLKRVIGCVAIALGAVAVSLG